MQHLLYLLCLIYTYITYTHTQILYQCNFDTATSDNTCFGGIVPVQISTGIGKADSSVPVAPLSDVTSSLKPTTNRELCKIPYKIGTYNWNMYFCNSGYCPTQSNLNTACSPGQFGYFRFTISLNFNSFILKTESSGINAIGQQCLIYYYFLTNMSRTEHTIEIRKEEIDGTATTIDSVNSTFVNGWNERRVTFNSMKHGYKIYFEFRRIGETLWLQSYIAVDEISIRQGACPPPQTTTTSTPITTTTSKPSTIITITESTTLMTSTTIITTTLTQETSSTSIPVTEISTISTSTMTDSTTTVTVTTSTTIPVVISSTPIQTTTTTITSSTMSNTPVTSSTTMGSTTTITRRSTSTSTKPLTTTAFLISTVTSTTTQSTGTTATRPPNPTTKPDTTTLGSKEDNNMSSKKILIIAIATAMPGVCVVGAFVIMIWMKSLTSATGGILGGASRRFMNIGLHDESSTLVELDRIPDRFRF